MPGRIDAKTTWYDAVKQVEEEDLKGLEATVEGIKTEYGTEGRQLQNFVQDHLLPVIRLLSGNLRKLAQVVDGHDSELEVLAQSGMGGGFTQIMSEHAEELVEQLDETSSILEGMHQQIVATGATGEALQAAQAMLERAKKGRALIEFINEVTMDGSEDDEDDEG